MILGSFTGWEAEFRFAAADGAVFAFGAADPGALAVGEPEAGFPLGCFAFLRGHRPVTVYSACQPLPVTVSQRSQ